ncbi:MAG: alpha/beta fold hydrolase, partial [Ferruginibacter sp.]|nr:alpha/beta fold hydrolase [Ferruginibacter sp.]
MKFSILLIFLLAFIFHSQPIIAQTTSSTYDSILLGKNDKVGKLVKTRGINMYYETYGQGEPLLIIHGNGGSINNFVNQVPYFSKSYKVILADSRAQGKSADAKDSLSYEMMTDDLNA